MMASKSGKTKVLGLDQLYTGLVVTLRGVELEDALELWVNTLEAPTSETPIKTNEIPQCNAPTFKWLPRTINKGRPILVFLTDHEEPETVIEGGGTGSNLTTTETFTGFIAGTMHGKPHEFVADASNKLGIPQKLIRSCFARLRGHGFDDDAGFTVEIRQVPDPSDGTAPTATFRLDDEKDNPTGVVLLLPVRFEIKPNWITLRRSRVRKSDNEDEKMNEALQRDASIGSFVVTGPSMRNILSASFKVVETLKDAIKKKKQNQKRKARRKSSREKKEESSGESSEEDNNDDDDDDDDDDCEGEDADHGDSGGAAGRSGKAEYRGTNIDKQPRSRSHAGGESKKRTAEEERPGSSSKKPRTGSLPTEHHHTIESAIDRYATPPPSSIHEQPPTPGTVSLYQEPGKKAITETPNPGPPTDEEYVMSVREIMSYLGEMAPLLHYSKEEINPD